MGEEKRRFSPPAVGGSSLLVIFAVLCLTIFALLSLSTVQADGRLGDAAVQAVTGWYKADTQAEAILAKLRSGEVPEGVELISLPLASIPEDDGNYLAAQYACPISNTQRLFVQVLFQGGLGDNYTITRWQAVSVANWDPDDSLSVWDGQIPD